jgi:hypothetical protein
MYDMHFLCSTTMQPNLELKLTTDIFLGYLPLDIIVAGNKQTFVVLALTAFFKLLKNGPMTIGIMTLSITTFSIMILSIQGLFMTFSIRFHNIDTVGNVIKLF